MRGHDACIYPCVYSIQGSFTGFTMGNLEQLMVIYIWPAHPNWSMRFMLAVGVSMVFGSPTPKKSARCYQSRDVLHVGMYISQCVGQ